MLRTLNNKLKNGIKIVDRRVQYYKVNAINFNEKELKEIHLK